MRWLSRLTTISVGNNGDLSWLFPTNKSLKRPAVQVDEKEGVELSSFLILVDTSTELTFGLRWSDGMTWGTQSSCRVTCNQCKSNRARQPEGIDAFSIIIFAANNSIPRHTCCYMVYLVRNRAVKWKSQCDMAKVHWHKPEISAETDVRDVSRTVTRFTVTGSTCTERSIVRELPTRQSFRKRRGYKRGIYEILSIYWLTRSTNPLGTENIFDDINDLTGNKSLLSSNMSAESGVGMILGGPDQEVMAAIERGNAVVFLDVALGEGANAADLGRIKLELFVRDVSGSLSSQV